MGLPSGNFSNAQAGRLQVSFNANFYTNTGNDFGSGTLRLRLRGFVGSGGDRQTVILGLDNHSGVIERSYAGGSAAVPVGLEYIDHELDGPSTVGATKLTVTCRLFNT